MKDYNYLFLNQKLNYAYMQLPYLIILSRPYSPVSYIKNSHWLFPQYDQTNYLIKLKFY
jgi:hypothetical protein